MNFIEGTRFSQKKHDKQKSPFKHLLKPKAGGIAFVLDAMQDHLTTIVDVTIQYPDGIPTFVDFLLGKIKTVHVNVKTIKIADELNGDYFNDRAYKIYFQKWLTQRWHDKDAILSKMIEESETSK